MRIGIDARLTAYRAGGIAEHIDRLLIGLEQLAPPEDIVVLEHRRAGRPAETPRTAESVLHRTRLWTPPHHRWEDALLPLEILPRRLDLLHCPDMVLPRGWRGPSVVTIHDLSFLHRPEDLTADALRYYRRALDSVSRADRIITVSEHTRREVLAHTPAQSNRIRVIPNALHPRYLAPDRDAAADTDRRFRPSQVHEDHRLTRNSYFLFVGTLEPRKNLVTLIDAYGACARRWTETGDVAEGAAAPVLVLAGHEGWHADGILHRARESTEGRIVITGPVAAEDLPPLYAGALALTHPAWDEGFGMTVAEAMAVGTPVLAARAGALPEVVGDAGILLPPDDPRRWADAMADLAADPGRRETLSAAGRSRAAQLTCRRMAMDTLAVYREAVAG